MALQLRDVGAVAGVGFLEGVGFGFDLTAGNAGDFGAEDGGEVGHGKCQFVRKEFNSASKTAR